MTQVPRRRRAKFVEEGTQLFSLRLPKPIWEELRIYAFTSGRTMNDLLREVVEHYWLEHPDRPRIMAFSKGIGAPKQKKRGERP